MLIDNDRLGLLAFAQRTATRLGNANGMRKSAIPATVGNLLDVLLLIPFSNVALFLPLIEQLMASRIGDHAFLGRNMVFHDLVNA